MVVIRNSFKDFLPVWDEGKLKIFMSKLNKNHVAMPQKIKIEHENSIY